MTRMVSGDLFGEPEIQKETMRKIVPVYGAHLIGDEQGNAYESLKTQVEIEGMFPMDSYVGHVWEPKVIDVVKSAKPSVVTLDGLDYDDLYDSMRGDKKFNAGLDFWFSFPGSPFAVKPEEKDLFVVGGDIPAFSLWLRLMRPDDVWFYYATYNGVQLSENRNKALDVFYARDVIGVAFIDYYYETTGVNIVEPNRYATSDAERVLAEDVGVEKELSRKVSRVGGLVAGIALLRQFAADKSGRVTRRSFLRGALIAAGGLISLAGGLNDARIPEGDWVHSGNIYARGKYPLRFLARGTDLNEVMQGWKMSDFRECLVAIKSSEAVQKLGEDAVSDGPVVSVWGTDHKGGNNHWNNLEQEREIVEGHFVAVLQRTGHMMKVYQEDVGDKGDFRKKIVRELARMFGGTIVFGIGKVPDTLTLEAVSRAIRVEDKYVSPAIIGIADSAARKCGFLR